MAGARVPPPINHKEAAKQAASRARVLLSPILRSIQEVALACGEPVAQLQLLRAAESIAESSGILFHLEFHQPSTFDALTMSVRARDHLRAALEALQAPEVGDRLPATCAPGVAQALALVFAAAKGGDWNGRDELRRARRRALENRSGSDADIPPQPQTTGSPSAMPVRQSPASGTPAVAAPPPVTPSGSPGPGAGVYPAPPRQADSRLWNRRVTGRTILEVDVGLASESNFFAGITMDVSTGGLFVATYQVQPVGTPVAVSLVLPDGHSVWAKGVVCWVRERSIDDSGDFLPGMGVRFTHIEADDLASIERFCKVRPPIYHDTDD